MSSAQTACKNAVESVARLLRLEEAMMYLQLHREIDNVRPLQCNTLPVIGSGISIALVSMLLLVVVWREGVTPAFVTKAILRLGRAPHTE